MASKLGLVIVLVLLASALCLRIDGARLLALSLRLDRHNDQAVSSGRREPLPHPNRRNRTASTHAQPMG